MRRLSQAGFRGDFVRPAILPDWWDESCDEDPTLITEVEIRIARFLNLTMSDVQNQTIPLASPSYEGAQLRRVRDLDPSRLMPAIHAAMQVASAVIRSLGETFPNPQIPSKNGLMWRENVKHAGRVIELDDLLGNLWERGIPIIPLNLLPVPNFQGMACVVEGRPMILLGHKHDEPSRVAHFVAHEVGHIVAGDCLPDRPIIDEEEEVVDEASIEHLADQYAKAVLVGDSNVPDVDANDFRGLAEKADEIEKSRGVDAGAVIFAWARSTGNYPQATMAVKALYRHTGARRQLRSHFERHIDLESATESDRALLHCVFGDPERNATTRR